LLTYFVVSDDVDPDGHLIEVGQTRPSFLEEDGG
jgi:hypothetical protein